MPYKGPEQQTFVIPYYMMYYVKSVMKNGNCLAVIFKKNDGKNILFHFSSHCSQEEKSVGLNLKEQGVYVAAK